MPPPVAPDGGASINYGVIAAVVIILGILLAIIRPGMETITRILAENQILQALLIPSGIACLAYVMSSLSHIARNKVVSRYFCSISISNKDPNYDAVLNYITSNCKLQTGSYMAQTKKKKRTWKERRDEFLMGKRKAPTLEFRPDNESDVHFLNYLGKRIMLSRIKGENITVGWNRKPMQMETLKLSSWGKDNSTIKQLILDAVSQSFEEESDEINIHVLSSDFWGGWEKALSKRPRPVDSVILDETLSQELLHDARTFLESSEWYAERGIPYRRGYLLYGAPGCGKTSSAEVLAGALKLDICMLTLSNKDLDDNKLSSSLREAPRRSIVLLEDVDAVFIERTLNKDSTPTSGVTFSGLLNAIDGVASQEGRIFFMTTNHVDKLDPALIRPGRCDVKIELKKASRAQIQRLFLRFFPGEEDLAIEFASKLPEYELSMAQLQGHLLECKSSASDAILRIPRLLKAARPILQEQMSTYDHLRRIGLEHIAPLFEHYGYKWRNELKGLEIGKVEHWGPEILTLPTQSKDRLKMLLEGDQELMKDYQLATVAQLKEIFIATYSNKSRDSNEFTRQSSSGLVMMPDEEEERSEVEIMAKSFCDKLSLHGKGLVSVWQLRWYVSLYDEPREALQNAHHLTNERDETEQFKWMTTEQWLIRCGLSQYTEAFHKNGFLTAKSFIHLTNDELKDLIGMKPEHAQIANAILQKEEKYPDILIGFQSPDRPRIQDDFIKTYPMADVKIAKQFARSISDGLGRGLVSLTQLHNFFHQNESPPSQVNNQQTLLKLLENRTQTAIQETGNEPWIAGWLKDLGMQEYLSGFLKEAIITEDNLLLPNPMDDFDSVGVKKLGHKRTLSAAVAKLAKSKPKEDDEKN